MAAFQDCAGDCEGDFSIVHVHQYRRGCPGERRGARNARKAKPSTVLVFVLFGITTTPLYSALLPLTMNGVARELSRGWACMYTMNL